MIDERTMNKNLPRGSGKKEVPSGKLTELAGISPFLIGNTSSIRVHFPASYVRLPECNKPFETKKTPTLPETNIASARKPSQKGK